MVDLFNPAGRDIAGAIGKGLAFRESREARTQQQERQAELQALIAQAFPGPSAPPLGGLTTAVQPTATQGLREVTAPTGLQGQGLTRDQALNRIFQIDPTIGDKLLESIGAISDFQKGNAASRAFEIRSTPPADRETVIRRQAQQLKSERRDPSDTLDLLNQSPEEQDQFLRAIELAALPVKERIEQERVTEEQRVKRTTKADEARIEDELKTTQERFKRSEKLRSEAERFEKPFRGQKAAIGRVQTAAQGALDGNAASAISLMFNFFKILDPASTVREGEIATAEQAGANIPTRFINQYNKLISGEAKLTPNQINGILKESQNQFSESKKLRDSEADKLISIARRFDIDERDIFGEPQAETAEAPNAVSQDLQEGTIIRNPQTGQRLQVVNGELVEIK